MAFSHPIELQASAPKGKREKAVETSREYSYQKQPGWEKKGRGKRVTSRTLPSGRFLVGLIRGKGRGRARPELIGWSQAILQEKRRKKKEKGHKQMRPNNGQFHVIHSEKSCGQEKKKGERGGQ